MRRRRDNTLLVIAVVIVVWRAILAAVLAGVLALLTSVSFWPAYLICVGVLLVWGAFRWSRVVRSYREHPSPSVRRRPAPG